MLITRRWRGCEQAWLGSRGWRDFGAERVMAGQDAEVAQQVQARRGHCGAQPNQQVVGLEHDGTSAVFPDTLQLELETSIGAAGQALESERRSGDVATEPLELSAVAAIDELFGVDADAEGFSDGLGRVVGSGSLGGQTALGRKSLADDEAQGGQACALGRRRE